MFGVHSGGSAPGSCCSVSSLYLTLTKRNINQDETNTYLFENKVSKRFCVLVLTFILPKPKRKDFTYNLYLAEESIKYYAWYVSRIKFTDTVQIYHEKYH